MWRLPSSAHASSMTCTRCGPGPAMSWDNQPAAATITRGRASESMGTADRSSTIPGPSHRNGTVEGPSNMPRSDRESSLSRA